MVKNLAKYKEKNPYGRQYAEEGSDDFFVDKERVITSKSFRRLEYKTQVFVNYEGDHYRTRLTHSLEVGQMAAAIANKLGLNYNLAEIIGLSHDLGHPPFGHAGERALSKAAEEFGGFDHNIQTLKIVCQLEEYSPYFPGLNLSLPVIEGLVKHNGPLKKNDNSVSQYSQILQNNKIDFHSNCSLEGQVAALADDITYLKHDIDDGIRAGFLDFDLLCGNKIFAKAYEAVEKKNLTEGMINKLTLRIIGNDLVNDLMKTSLRNINQNKICSKEDLLSLPFQIINFSAEKQKEVDELRNFLHKKVYRHYKVNRMNMKAERIIKDLFQAYMEFPNISPKFRQDNFDKKKLLAQDIINYIAGMTDRYAVEEHKKIFNLQNF